MPQGLTNYAEQKLLDLIFGGTAYTPPATLYFGLHVGGSAPDMEAGTGIVEPSGNAYARVAVTNNVTNFPASTQNASNEAEKANTNVITFPQATGNWGTATHFFIADASTAGNYIAIGALSASKAISANDTASFAAGSLVVNLD